MLGVLAWWYAVDLAVRLSWGRLLLVSYAGGLAWMLALATVDGIGGVGDVLDHPYEYLRTARATTDLPATLRRVRRAGSPSTRPEPSGRVHIAGHPPGALTFFVLLVRLGLGSGLAAGLVVTLLAASTALAVLQTMRVLGAEPQARLAAPFLVIGPAAVWQCCRRDAMFAAWAAWGMCALALAAAASSFWRSVRGRSWPGCCWAGA